MFKQSLILSAILSLLIVGCSSDDRFQREVDGNEDYLSTPEIRSLIVPNGMKVPQPVPDFFISKAASEGMVGHNVDIRPPVLPLAIVPDSSATYQTGEVLVDLPEYVGFWTKIPGMLTHHNIAIEHNDNQSIKTGSRFITQGDKTGSIEARYLLQRQVTFGREYIKIKLISLKQNGQDISADVLESQRYTVDFYNMLVNDLPSSIMTSETEAEN